VRPIVARAPKGASAEYERNCEKTTTHMCLRFRRPNGLPFNGKPAADPASRFYTMSLRRDWQVQRHVRRCFHVRFSTLATEPDRRCRC